MLRKSQFIFFTCQKLILAHFCKLLYKDRDLWWPNKYRVASFSQFFPAKVKKILRKSQPQICEKLRKLSLRKKSVFLIKKRVLYNYTMHLHKDIFNPDRCSCTFYCNECYSFVTCCHNFI